MIARRWLSLAALLLGLVGCSRVPIPAGVPYSVIGGDPERTIPAPDVPQAEWTASRRRLAELRRALPKKPYVQRVRVGLVDPRNGQLYRARGAVAVSPEKAARLVLLGPGGTTAIDVWVTKDRFRFAVPAMKIERRGGVDPTDAVGLPIGFLRWWFLSPLAGELLVARSSRSEASFLLKTDRATVTLRTNGERFIAIRREGTHLEGLEWLGQGLAPQAGARGMWVENDWGLSAQVLVEEVLDEEPDPDAFVDPDATSPDAPADAKGERGTPL